MCIRDSSHARRHMRNPLNSSHAPSAAAGVSNRICKTLALLPPACAVMGSSAGSSAAQKSHASERRQSSTARIGTLKSTSQANAQSIEQHTSGIEPLGHCRATTGVDQELSCRELGSATRKQARPTQILRQRSRSFAKCVRDREQTLLCIKR